MKNTKIILRAAIAAVLCAVALAHGAQAKVYTADEIADAIRGILAYELSQNGYDSVQSWLDSGTVSEWYAIGLRQSGEKLDFSKYGEALKEIYQMSGARSPALSQKYALALIFAGRGEDEEISRIAGETIGAQGIISYIFGLHLITNGAQPENHNAESVISEILALQLADGGWALSGAASDVDITAMAIQALAPYYGQNIDVKAAVDRALGLLSERQLEDGGFASLGSPNAESAAQVIVALSSLGVDIQQDERFVKGTNTAIDGLLKYRRHDGSFAHAEGGEYNQSATSQAYYSLVAYLRCLGGRTPLYVLDDEDAPLSPGVLPGQEEAEKGADTTNPDTADISDTDLPDASDEHGASGKGGYKIWVILGIVSAAAIVISLFWLTGRRNPKNFIFIIALATAACVIVSFVEIRAPEEYYTGAPTTKENAIGSVALIIRCDVLVGVATDEHIPADGVILPETEFLISEGDTVYDVLIEAARAYGIHTDTRGTNYIAGIANIYELDYGDLSGWTYLVNGESPSVGCGEYVLKSGDKIEWVYTLALGDDIR